jgi:murein DD-endopeptidase MepM/ murein hydrolase activator NlpD
MKNIKLLTKSELLKRFNLLKKFVIALFGTMIFTIIIIILFSASTTTAKGGDSISQKYTTLIYENYKLRTDYNVLQKRMTIVDSQLVDINRYNKYIYSQIFGINNDTSDIEISKADSINFSTEDANAIFTNLDERNLQTSELASEELAKFTNTSDLVKKNKYALNSYPNISPIKAINVNCISSEFGWRKHPIYDSLIFHSGIDITVNPGTNIYSTINGKVDKIEYSNYGYGNVLIIKNSFGFETLYAHLSQKIFVRKNQYIKKGQLIATTGSSGSTTGPHLHYEIRQNDKLKDPLIYFFIYLTPNLIAKK